MNPFIVAALLFSTSATANEGIFEFSYNLETKAIAACDRAGKHSFGEWIESTIKYQGNSGAECKSIEGSEDTIECGYDGKPKFRIIGKTDKQACKNARKQLSKDFGVPYFTYSPEEPSSPPSLKKEVAEKLYAKKLCNNLISFKILKKLGPNTYQITNIRRAMSVYRGSAILETRGQSFDKSGVVYDLRVEVRGEKTVTLEDGFEKKLPLMIESADCDSYYKAIGNSR